MKKFIFPVGLMLMISLSLGCRVSQQGPAIPAAEVSAIELVQVSHPYLGGRVQALPLDKALHADFLQELSKAREQLFKFYSCYVIKIHFQNGEFLSYRTNGMLLESLHANGTNAGHFQLPRNINIVSKYWHIPEKDFCKLPVVDPYLINGSWYLNQWTMYHTLQFDDSTVFVDNHIDTVFRSRYSISNDSLVLSVGKKGERSTHKILLLSPDSLVLQNFADGRDTLRYSREKRPREMHHLTAEHTNFSAGWGKGWPASMLPKWKEG
jgi:hypothetical protein